jgi:hypothetical protein
MRQMLALFRQERIDIILATRLDRLSRNAVDTEALMRLRGTRVVLLQQTLDEATATGRMGRRMTSVISQFEREMIGDRVSYKIAEMARQGMRAGGWAPPGLRISGPHQYVLDEHYSQMVEQVFNWAAEGVSIGEITARLRGRGYVVRPREIQRRTGPTKMGGRPFTWDQVKGIIRNPIYRATIRVRDGEFPANLPRIVSDELWHRANAKIKVKERPPYVARQNKHELLLHGLGMCGSCKRPLVAHPATSRTGSIYLYYRCQNVRKNGISVGCLVRQIPARKLEEAIVAQVGLLARDPAVLDAAIEQASSGRRKQLSPVKAELAMVEETVVSLRTRFKALSDRLVLLPKGSPFWQAISKEGDDLVLQQRMVESQRDQLLERKAQLEQGLGEGRSLRSDLIRFTDIFAALTPEKKRQALQLLIRRIVVSPVNTSGIEERPIGASKRKLRQKKQFLVNLDLHVKPRLTTSLRKEAGIFVFHTEMAAQGGIRDKILRVSMPFEKRGNSMKKLRSVPSQKSLIPGSAVDPWAVVLKVRSWATRLKEGKVRSCAEIARREGITPARVSQLWPLGKITTEQVDDALKASSGRDVSLRKLILVVRNPEVK